MVSDFSTFCFQASVALLIALLAWGDEIRQPRRAVTEIEQRFLSKLRRTKSELAPVLDDSIDPHTGSMKYSLTDVTQTAAKMMKSGQLDQANVSTIEKLEALKTLREGLECRYLLRYFLTIFLCGAFGLFGILATFSLSESLVKVNGYDVTLLTVYSGCLVAACSLILANLVTTYFKEDEFLQRTGEANDQIEVKGWEGENPTPSRP